MTETNEDAGKVEEETKEPWSLFFRDGKTRIDYVLVYNADESDAEQIRKREIFELNLRAEKLVLEREEPERRTLRESGDADGGVGVGVGGQLPPEDAAEVLGFLKVHAPFEVLAKYAEALKMHAPVKSSIDCFVRTGRLIKTADCRALLDEEAAESTLKPDSVDAEAQKASLTLTERFFRMLNVYPALEPIQRRCTVPFAMYRAYLFDLRDKDNFFEPKDRSHVVEYILQRKSYTRMPTEIDSALTSVEPAEDDSKARECVPQSNAHNPNPNPNTNPECKEASSSGPNEMGINRLLIDGVYLAAFPLHDCPLTLKHRTARDSDYFGCMRHQLWREWADFRNAIKIQPINHIQRYFGDAVAWYFAWLGFYTRWLIPLTLIGILTFVYGLSTAYDAKVAAFCAANTTMCPLCLKGCPYWQMSSQCVNFVIRRIFENPLTFIWGVVVTMWCTLFLENWKRTQFTLRFQWNLFGVEKDEEPPRPEFAALAQGSRRQFHTKPHPITGRQEVYVPFWTARLPNYAISVTTVLFGMVLVSAAVAGVVIYRIVMQTITFQSGSAFFTRYGPVVASATGAVISLFCIMLLGLVYNYVAVWLTNREYWRTQSEYDNALMAKLVALQCVNYYAPTAYTAFLKGQFVSVSDYATVIDRNRTRGFSVDFTIDECPSGSCLPDLCIQLIIIMCYKQLIQNNVLEILLPKFKIRFNDYLKKRRRRKAREGSQTRQDTITTGSVRELRVKSTSLHGNYKLQEVGPRPLFSEYLEMIIQYGFVSIFAIAFPLAPLFALLNNILEIRIDARKFLVDFRRPVAVFDSDIGIWYQVLFLLSRIAVITNGALIAFTTEMIPNLLYTRMHEYSYGTNMVDFNYTLYTRFAYSVLNTSVLHRAGASAFRSLKLANDTIIRTDPGTCWYKGFNNPPDVAPPAIPYDLSKIFWHVLAWRIAVFVTFENVILLLTEVVAYLIPDVPRSVELNQRKERHLLRRLMLKADTLIALRHERVNAVPQQKLSKKKTFKRRSSIGGGEVASNLPQDFSADELSTANAKRSIAFQLEDSRPLKSESGSARPEDAAASAEC